MWREFLLHPVKGVRNPFLEGVRNGGVSSLCGLAATPPGTPMTALAHPSAPIVSGLLETLGVERLSRHWCDTGEGGRPCMSARSACLARCGWARMRGERPRRRTRRLHVPVSSSMHRRDPGGHDRGQGLVRPTTHAVEERGPVTSVIGAAVACGFCAPADLNRKLEEPPRSRPNRRDTRLQTERSAMPSGRRIHHHAAEEGDDTALRSPPGSEGAGGGPPDGLLAAFGWRSPRRTLMEN